MTESKTVLVTGAARGIGLAVAQGLSDAGHKVVIADFDRAVLDAAPFDGLKLNGDVSSPEDCERLVAETVEAHGALDVLVNNAGLGMGFIREDHFSAPVKITEVTPEQWQTLFAVNSTGPFLMTRAATPGMVARGWGRVVNVTTSFFTMLNEGFAPYGPTKAALEAASVIWSKEFDGTGVTVNVVVPGGPTDTRMVPAESGFSRDDLIPVTAMVPPIRWLSSPASDGVTGRRFIGSLWNADLADTEAAAGAGAPAAWPDLTTNVVWPDDPPAN
jgi:NAD(P)-dependent dehydrogenase (short-subunit alcohol dehydrogenase family)